MGGQKLKKSVNISNRWKKRHKRLILMPKLKLSKQIRSEASKNKVSNDQKSIKHITNLSKCKWIINKVFEYYKKAHLKVT